MKFSKSNCGGNLLINNESLSTPGCVMYSRSGIIPHLMENNLKAVGCQIWHIPLGTIYEQPGVEVMEAYGKSFKEFSSLNNTILLLNPSDSLSKEPFQRYTYNEEKSISIWTPGGRRKMSPDEYMKCFQTFSFDICISPSDCIPAGLTRKRCRKSVDRTLRFLDRCLKIKEEKNMISSVFAAIEGGDSLFERERCAKSIAGKNVDGYNLSGFHHVLPNWKELLQTCLKHLPEEKPKVMFGVLTPDEVIDAVEMGIDIFDTVIAYDLTERGCAFCFKYRNKRKYVEVENPSEEKPSNGCPEETSAVHTAKCGKNLEKYEINLNDKCYFDDTSAIVAGCSCYCCTHYTKAYIHHLLVTKEMLASVALMMHNTHHWLLFFEEIREYKQMNKLDELRNLLHSS